VEVLDAGVVGELGELEVVGGEERPGLAALEVAQVQGDGLGQGQAVPGAGAPADLVQDDEAGGGDLV